MKKGIDFSGVIAYNNNCQEEMETVSVRWNSAVSSQTKIKKNVKNLLTNRTKYDILSSQGKESGRSSYQSPDPPTDRKR